MSTASTRRWSERRREGRRLREAQGCWFGSSSQAAGSQGVRERGGLLLEFLGRNAACRHLTFSPRGSCWISGRVNCKLPTLHSFVRAADRTPKANGSRSQVSPSRPSAHPPGRFRGKSSRHPLPSRLASRELSDPSPRTHPNRSPLPFAAPLPRNHGRPGRGTS